MYYAHTQCHMANTQNPIDNQCQQKSFDKEPIQANETALKEWKETPKLNFIFSLQDDNLFIYLVKMR